jgi:hypothetical protein
MQRDAASRVPAEGVFFAEVRLNVRPIEAFPYRERNIYRASQRCFIVDLINTVGFSL